MTDSGGERDHPLGVAEAEGTLEVCFDEDRMMHWSIPQLALVRNEPHGWGYAAWTPPTGLAYGRVDRIGGRGHPEFKKRVLDLRRALNELRTGALLLLAGGLQEDDGCTLDDAGLDIVIDLEEAGVALDDVVCRSRGQIMESLTPLAPGSAAELGPVLAVHQATGVRFSQDDTASALAVGLLVAVAGAPLAAGVGAPPRPDPRERPPAGPPGQHLATGSNEVTDALLTVQQLADLLGIVRSSAYRLVRHLPVYRVPGVGVRLRRSDVEAWLASHRRNHVGTTPRSHRRGTPVASARDDDDAEVLPGLTRRQLKEQAEF